MNVITNPHPTLNSTMLATGASDHKKTTNHVVCRHDDVIKWKRVTDLLCGEFTGYRWITKASDAELWCFLWSAPEARVGQTMATRWFETPSPRYDVIVMVGCNVVSYIETRPRTSILIVHDDKYQIFSAIMLWFVDHVVSKVEQLSYVLHIQDYLCD